MSIGIAHFAPPIEEDDFRESAIGKCASYCLMALFPLNMMLAVVAVQCETPKRFFCFVLSPSFCAD